MNQDEMDESDLMIENDEHNIEENELDMIYKEDIKKEVEKLKKNPNIYDILIINRKTGATRHDASRGSR